MKIFDFGLSTCVKARKEQTEAYKMTGYTGSLRYMAPEVALRQTYTELVDVYSFGLILWQMARDRVPFQPYNKQEILQYVVSNHERPKLSASWPPKFCALLADCWHQDYLQRPSFAEIVTRLTQLQEETQWFYPVRRWMSA
jgi:serine/threonine protein kinase